MLTSTLAGISPVWRFEYVCICRAYAIDDFACQLVEFLRRSGASIVHRRIDGDVYASAIRMNENEWDEFPRRCWPSGGGAHER